MTEREMKRKKAARKARQRKARNRRVLVTALLMLVVCVASIGGTIAWLTDTTGSVQNTFTTSDITIRMEEEGAELVDGKKLMQSFKMVPGFEIDKKPLVVIEGGSEDCWVFLKVKAQKTDTYLNWEINPANWTFLKENTANGITEAVYYCKATDVVADRAISVLGYKTDGGEFVKDKVLVRNSVTKADMEALNGTSVTPVLLSFEASAIQLYQTNGTEFGPMEAWNTLVGD